jgi:hypothetical protein
VRRTPRHLHAKVLVDQRVQLHPVHARQESRYVGARDHTGFGVLRDLSPPRNAVTERAKNARDCRPPTEDRSDHPRHHKRSRMAFASIIAIIGSLTDRLDKIADICFRIHYIEAHGLSPFETQYGLVTLIILRFPKDFL